MSGSRKWIQKPLTSFIFLSLLSLSSFGQHLTGLRFDSKNAPYITLKERNPSMVDLKLPEIWDWRKINGVNWISSVRSQQTCGSCVAFGLASVFESQLKITKGLWWWNPLISVQDLFACGGGDCTSGWSVEEALFYLDKYGVTDESCSPYKATSGPESCNSCHDRAERIWKPTHVVKVTGGQVNRQKIKRALQNGPLWTHMTVYDDFRNYKFGVYRHSWGNIESGHTLAIIGYEDKLQSWIVKNSWGDLWGDQGYGYIHYDDISGLGNESYQFVFEEKKHHAVIKNIKDGQVVTDIHQVQISSNLPNKEKLYLMAYSHISSESFLIGSCFNPNCLINLNPEVLKEGKFRLQVINNNLALSTWPIEIIVLNSNILNLQPDTNFISLSNMHFNKENWLGSLKIKQPISRLNIEFLNLKDNKIRFSKTFYNPSTDNELKIDFKPLSKGSYKLTLIAYWNSQEIPNNDVIAGDKDILIDYY